MMIKERERGYVTVNKGLGEGQTGTETWEEWGFEREGEVREVLNGLAKELVGLKKDKEKGTEIEMRRVIGECYERLKAANHYGLEPW